MANKIQAGIEAGAKPVNYLGAFEDIPLPICASRCGLASVVAPRFKRSLLCCLARRIGDQNHAACSCYYHTVLILEDWAFVFSRDEGRMVPWHTRNNFALPQMDYFDCRVEIEPSARQALLSYVREQMEQHQAGEAEQETEAEAGSCPSM